MPKYVGIDIGTASVKVVVVKSSYRKQEVEGLASAEITGDVLVAIREATQKALGGAGAGDAVAAALPGTRAAVRIVSIPASAERQLADVLPFELEAQTPFDLDESVVDYRILGGGARGAGVMHAEEGALAVMAVVAKIEDVRARIDLVRDAVSVEPERVGVGGFPLANLAPLATSLSEEGPVALLDLGTRTSDLLVLRRGETVFSRTLSLGTEGLPGTAAKLAREVRLSLSALQAQGVEAPLLVYLCGGGAFVSGAESFLAGELELPVKRLPQLSVDLGPRAAPATDMPLYAKALGLAMGLATRGPSFDLRKGPLVYERGFGWLRDKVPVLVGLGAVLAVSFIFSSCTAIYAESKERSTLESALGQVTQEVLGEKTTSATHAEELLAQQGTPDEDPLPHADAFDVMVRLSEHIPQSMTHDIEELDVQKGHVTVHGIVGSIPDAQSIAESLSKNEPCFDDVKITRTNQVVGGDRQKYVLEFDLKCPEDQHAKKKKKKSSAGTSSSASAGGGK